MDVEPFVALQADQLRAEEVGEHLGQFGLAHARVALDQQGTPEPEEQKDDGRQLLVGHVAFASEAVNDGVDLGAWAHWLGHGAFLRCNVQWYSAAFEEAAEEATDGVADGLKK